MDGMDGTIILQFGTLGIVTTTTTSTAGTTRHSQWFSRYGIDGIKRHGTIV